MATVPQGVESDSDVGFLIPYVTELEFEVDRLRKQGRFIEYEAWLVISGLRTLCDSLPTGQESESFVSTIRAKLEHFAQVLVDLHQHPGFHPAHDQVCPIAIRPLIEQVFRWHQRLERLQDVSLHVDLDVEYLDWFPARLRHILDNLVGNALRPTMPGQGEARITIGLRRLEKGYELRVTDNRTGRMPEARMEWASLFRRTAPAGVGDMRVGLTVVRTLIQQSGGSLTVQSDENLGTCFLAVLPRYDVDDYLERELVEFRGA